MYVSTAFLITVGHFPIVFIPYKEDCRSLRVPLYRLSRDSIYKHVIGMALDSYHIVWAYNIKCGDTLWDTSILYNKLE